MGKLNGKVGLVTGAAKGLGASFAEHLAAEGASVVVNYATSKAAAEAVVSRIEKKGGEGDRGSGGRDEGRGDRAPASRDEEGLRQAGHSGEQRRGV